MVRGLKNKMVYGGRGIQKLALWVWEGLKKTGHPIPIPLKIGGYLFWIGGTRAGKGALTSFTSRAHFSLGFFFVILYVILLYIFYLFISDN